MGTALLSVAERAFAALTVSVELREERLNRIHFGGARLAKRHGARRGWRSVAIRRGERRLERRPRARRARAALHSMPSTAARRRPQPKRRAHFWVVAAEALKLDNRHAAVLVHIELPEDVRAIVSAQPWAHDGTGGAHRRAEQHRRAALAVVDSREAEPVAVTCDVADWPRGGTKCTRRLSAWRAAS